MAAGAGRGVPGAELPPSLSLRVTNGGKTTLTRKLMQALPNCSVVHQDDFFKVRRGAGGGWSRLGLGAAAGGGASGRVGGRLQSWRGYLGLLLVICMQGNLVEG